MTRLKKLTAFFVAMILTVLLVPASAFAANYNGTITTDYGTFKYETGTHAYSNDLKLQIFLNGELKNEYDINDCQITANSASFTASGNYHILDVKKSNCTWSRGVGSSDTVYKGTLTLDIGSRMIKIYMSSPFTVKVNYDYTDKSESNPKITTLESYSKTVYWGEEFESNKWNYYDAGAVRNSYEAVVTDQNARTISNSGTAVLGYYFKDTVKSDITYTVTFTPQNKDDYISFDAYIYRGGGSIGFDRYSDINFRYFGYRITDENANEDVYIVKDGKLQSAAFTDGNNPAYIYAADKFGTKKWWDYSYTGIGANNGHVKEVFYRPSEQNWYYVYRWNTNLDIIDVSWENVVGPVVIPVTERGRLNFVYKEHTKESPYSTHVWSEWERTADPTCTVKGSEKRVCTHCGLEETRDVNPLGHDMTKIPVHNDGTERLNSTHRYVCQRNGCTYYEDEACAFTETSRVEPSIGAGGLPVDGYVEYTCSKCGYKYTDPLKMNSGMLKYDPNGGTGAPEDNTQYAVDATVTLNSTIKPIHDDVDGYDVLFLGWTAAKQSTIFAAGDTAPTYITSATIAQGGTTVYAAWGYDKNGNGTPDVDEDTYSLNYDANGGSNAPSDSNKYLAGEKVTLSTTKPTHADESGEKVAFIGWTESKIDAIIKADGTAPTTVTEVTMPAANKTVYAAWGEDTNGNGTADVLEDKYNLTYDANGGSGAPTDSNKYITGEEVTLSTVEPSHDKSGDDDVVFIGWTEEKVADVLTKDDTAPTTIDKVTFATADKTVYAAWGVDTNGNGTADVLEDKYNLTYDANGGTGAPTDSNGYIVDEKITLSTTKPTHADESGEKVAFIGWTETKESKILEKNGTVPTVVTEVTMVKDGKTVYAAWGYDKNGNGTPDILEDKFNLIYDANGGTGAPVDSEKYTTDEEVTLSTTEPTHAKSGDDDVLFIGWTEEKVTDILTKDDTAPTTVTKVTIPAADKTVYAAWGVDANGNGTADVLEEKYRLTYNANGGAGAPTDTNGYIVGEKVTLSATKPTHADEGAYKVAFIGWTETQESKIFEKSDTAPATVTEVTMTKEGKTVYAAWGFDKNGNGTADILEDKYTLTYDANGGTGAPTDSNKYTSGEEVTLSAIKPTHADADGVKVAFIGWTDKADSKIYTKDDAAPTILSKVVITADKTVYAAWGEDTNGNGTADVLETWYTLTYDANGGTAAPAVQSAAAGSDGKAVIDLTSKKPSYEWHTFKGWSTTKGGKVEYNPGQKITLTKDTTLYAVWEKTSSPNTGDESDMFLWAALMASSAVAMTGVWFSSRKKKETK